VSTIAGIFMLDGGAVDAVEVQRLSDALAHRAADDVSIWRDGPIGLIARLWHTTPESRQARQPYHTAASGLSIVLDGRIDNRDDLRAALRGHVDVDAAAADVELLAAAYGRWGADCAAHLVGDFAFAVWDARTRRLCCSRDVIGLRPLFFRAGAKRFAWASEPHALLRIDGTAPAANERMVGEYLTFIIDKTETLLEGVCRLAPAHTLVVDGSGVRSWQYWDIDPHREIRYADDRDYVEHLRSLLAGAVRAQTRSATPVGVMLSGGLDSSTVLAMAQPLRPGGQAVTAYSIAADGAQDESAYFGEAAAGGGARAGGVGAALWGARRWSCARICRPRSRSSPRRRAISTCPTIRTPRPPVRSTSTRARMVCG
jgi:asparagine synthase (glutamine-hydrolysing)